MTVSGSVLALARLVLVGAPLGALTLVAGGCGGGDASETPSATPGDESAANGANPVAGVAVEDPLASDPWITAVLSTCDEDSYYDRDTSDMLAILVGKLEHGRGEPLKRSIEELGALGAEAVPELRRMLDRQLNDASRAGSIQNTLGALSRNQSPEATEQLLRALDHPHQTIRTVALRGLQDRPLPPEEFERLAGLARVTATAERGMAMRALHSIDRDEAALRLLDWLERGELQTLEEVAMPLILASRDPRAIERARELADDPDPRIRGWLAAMLAAAGDVDARRQLAEHLLDERRVVRNAALQAASTVGLWPEVTAVFEYDPDPTLRAAAAASLHSGLIAVADGGERALEIAPTPAEEAAARAALRRALDDGDPSVADEALYGLVVLGDEEALARALSRLDGPPMLVSTVLPPLRERLRRDPGLCPRVVERLRRRLESEDGLPWPQRAASFQALSVVPSRGAAELLMEYALRAEADGAVLSGSPAHRWFCVHATNTGADGRAYLAELLAVEPDPVRRLDLTFAVGGERDELARQTLLGRVDDASLPPLERVYVASLLASLGPATRMAPHLKRTTLRTEDPTARVGLQCLLWYWY